MEYQDHSDLPRFLGFFPERKIPGLGLENWDGHDSNGIPVWNIGIILIFQGADPDPSRFFHPAKKILGLGLENWDGDDSIELWNIGIEMIPWGLWNIGMEMIP